MDGGWRRTPAFERSVVTIGALTVLAVVLRRVDLVVLAAPFVLGTAIALSGRVPDPPRARLSASAAALLEGDTVTVTVTVTGAEPQPGDLRLDVVATAVRHGGGIQPPGWPSIAVRAAYAGQAALPVPAEPTELELTMSATRWGRVSIGPAELVASAAAGMYAAGPVVLSPLYVPVWPLRDGFSATDAVPRARGMVGAHRSRRIGAGTDIAEVRPFQLGDRLRGINWRVSLRTERLHVTSTVSDRDTDVALCLDTWQELRGAEVTSLDLAVRAAAAIGEHYLRAGDRVSMLDLGQPMRRVPAGAGRAHLVRILDVLLDARGDRTHDEARTALAMADLPADGLVVVLSPLVGDEAFGAVARLARGGRPVVVVDTVPPDARPDEYDSWTLLAWRLWRLDRQNGIGRLAELGVPVVPWRGSGSLDEVLRDVTRATRAPRIAR